MRPAKHPSFGFTLLEVIIAVAIFAIIGLGCWQVLDRVITSKEIVEARSAHLRQLQKAMWLMSRDIRNITDRPVRDNYGEPLPAVSSLISGFTLSFTHGGWANPLGQQRSTLQRVAYALEPDENGQQLLVRYYWEVLDRPPQSEPVRQVIIDQVGHFEVQFIDSQGNAQFHWPVTNSNNEVNAANVLPNPVPAGILLRLEVSGMGEIERLYALQNLEVAP